MNAEPERGQGRRHDHAVAAVATAIEQVEEGVLPSVVAGDRIDVVDAEQLQGFQPFEDAGAAGCQRFQRKIEDAQPAAVGELRTGLQQMCFAEAARAPEKDQRFAIASGAVAQTFDDLGIRTGVVMIETLGCVKLEAQRNLGRHRAALLRFEKAHIKYRAEKQKQAGCNLKACEQTLLWPGCRFHDAMNEIEQAEVGGPDAGAGAAVQQSAQWDHERHYREDQDHRDRKARGWRDHGIPQHQQRQQAEIACQRAAVGDAGSCGHSRALINAKAVFPKRAPNARQSDFSSSLKP